jgi:hypothetical protein
MTYKSRHRQKGEVMYGSLELMSLIDQRREEALREAQERHLASLARGSREPSRVRRIRLTWAGALALLGRAELSE